MIGPIGLRQATKDIDTNPNITSQLLFKLVHNFSEPIFFHHSLLFTHLTSRIGQCGLGAVVVQTWCGGGVHLVWWHCSLSVVAVCTWCGGGAHLVWWRCAQLWCGLGAVVVQT